MEAAGGLADGADLDRVNLAAPGRRRQGVHPPGRPGRSRGDHPGRVRVGRSAFAGLPAGPQQRRRSGARELPGVGPATAAAIVEHREANGAFASVGALLEVRGIGGAKLDALRTSDGWLSWAATGQWLPALCCAPPPPSVLRPSRVGYS
ncbi:MAG: helix-hairpin-helix domain-containing protein [Microthrixaceae bacterium]